MISKNVTVKDGRFVSKAKVTDTIYKGFMLYKAGTNEFEAKKQDTGEQFNGSLDDVKNKIDKYWERKDAEEVLKAKNKDGEEIIFIRNSTKKEQESPTEKRKAFNSFPDKEGYIKTYMPYGEKGRGFYYSKIKDNKNKDGDDGYTTITVVVKDQDSALFNCIQKIKKLADPGHSFGGVLDPDGDNPEQIGFDGDGSFFIKSITKTNGDKTEYAGVGKHNDTPDEDFDTEQLAIGIEVEKEHTDNEDIAKAIAKDHLSEIPDYYTRLKAMEETEE